MVGLAVQLRALGGRGLVAFLDAGTPPLYAGFGSMPMRASEDAARMAIEAIRAQGRRALVSHGWADLALIDAVSRERPPASA